MKRRMMMIGIAVAALLLATENIQAQSREVRRARTENRADDRLIRLDDPRRPGRVQDDKPVRRKKKVVDNDVIRAFARESFDSNRLNMADMIFSTGGLMNVEQIIRVSRMFSYDTNRVKFLKKAYFNCVDRHNYYKVLATLDYSSSRDNVIRFVQDNRYDGPRDEPYYKVSNSDMGSILKALKNEDFDSTRERMAKMIVSGSLLTTRQIADMAKTFNYDSNRKGFLLYAYESCIDPQNYYIAVNTLEFSSNRNDVMRKITRP